MSQCWSQWQSQSLHSFHSSLPGTTQPRTVQLTCNWTPMPKSHITLYHFQYLSRKNGTPTWGTNSKHECRQQGFWRVLKQAPGAGKRIRAWMTIAWSLSLWHRSSRLQKGNWKRVPRFTGTFPGSSCIWEHFLNSFFQRIKILHWFSTICSVIMHALSKRYSYTK